MGQAKPHTKVGKDAIRRKRAITSTLYLPADEGQAERLQSAQQRRGLALFTGDKDELEKYDAELDAIKEEVAESGLVLTFKAVGRKRFDAILNEHPATEAMQAEDKDKPEEERRIFNPETFWPALMAETVLSELTADEWRDEVFDSTEWNSAELKDLRDKAQEVNTTTRVADLGN